MGQGDLWGRLQQRRRKKSQVPRPKCGVLLVGPGPTGKARSPTPTPQLPRTQWGGGGQRQWATRSIPPWPCRGPQTTPQLSSGRHWQISALALMHPPHSPAERGVPAAMHFHQPWETGNFWQKKNQNSERDTITLSKPWPPQPFHTPCTLGSPPCPWTCGTGHVGLLVCFSPGCHGGS